ncbi:hypothetical protein CEXT_727881 [Caerostris extrusa]|uniref:Uncharacterized protein n=1 Tax=Caerostris extrusa TaxID=172846 RepID=A0AAV4N230_CAEEX|nr:hypothetical protein CEXT_727881 [Caerostris extrusa]
MPLKIYLVLKDSVEEILIFHIDTVACYQENHLATFVPFEANPFQTIARLTEPSIRRSRRGAQVEKQWSGPEKKQKSSHPGASVFFPISS